MKNFPEKIQFKYAWRSYQKRVLDELNEHLDDRQLHVIAPPGSGKTVLGLEVMLRLNRPTLILAPTLTIKNQWIQRFCELFLQEIKRPEWISTDIRHPKFLTVATYQGLHKLKEELQPPEEEDAWSQFLKSSNIEVVIADEAHHLKNAWWQTLTDFKTQLNPFTVGLTATPPYDVSFSEWQRYMEFNGPIDAEISTPELVAVNDLCPHQDFIYLSYPARKEYERILDFRNEVNRYFEKIKSHEALVDCCLNHPFIVEPEENIEDIYSNFNDYASLLIFLKENAVELSELHLEIIGGGEISFPEFDYEWAEKLLDFFLHRKDVHFEKYKSLQKEIRSEIKIAGILQGSKINFQYSIEFNNHLSTSIRKLKAIEEIVQFEHQQLEQQLRMVILTDYIRKEYLAQTETNDLELDKIGVVSIFEQLRRNKSIHAKVGVLTGSLIILPKKTFTEFENQCEEYQVETKKASPLKFDDNFLVIQIGNSNKNHLVQIITTLFRKGEIEILIGTKALLGEGWDAPSINSLILASFVGSFVSSNQMRGRAIRTFLEDKNKTANIWHLACIDPTQEGGGADLDLMRRRFNAFLGISMTDDGGIENGLNRIQLPHKLHSLEDVNSSNQLMFKLAESRNRLNARWKNAIKKGTHISKEIKAPAPSERNIQKEKVYHTKRSVAFVLSTLLSAVGWYLLQNIDLIWNLVNNKNGAEGAIQILSFLLLGAILSFGILAYRSIWMTLSYQDISKDIKHIGDTILVALHEIGEIHTPLKNLRVNARVENNGTIFCHMEGGRAYEKAIFIDALSEVLGPVDSPRYILIRKSSFWNIIQQKDFHAVPNLLGKNQQYAMLYADLWTQIVGKCELVFTRNIDGRKTLLKARMKSLAAQFEPAVEQVQKWR